jgi:hypothetical protein
MPGRVKLDPILSIVVPSVGGNSGHSYKTETVFREELCYGLKGFNLVRKVLERMMEHDDIPGASDFVNGALEDADTVLKLGVRLKIRVDAEERSKPYVMQFLEQGAGATADVQNPRPWGDTKLLNAVRWKRGPKPIPDGLVETRIRKNSI